MPADAARDPDRAAERRTKLAELPAAGLTRPRSHRMATSQG
jgi:hypothetical protein